MKFGAFIQAAGLSISIALNGNCGTMGKKAVLPGLTYYGPHAELTGKLVFLLRHDRNSRTNSPNAASIYELDPRTGSLQRVTNGPNGVLFTSSDGNTFCVVYRPGSWSHSEDTNAFIYSTLTARGLAASLDAAPKETVVFPTHVFFACGVPESTALIDYNVTTGESRLIELADASRWEYQHYNRIHAPKGETNFLHFYYDAFGKRVKDGKDYLQGFYSVEVSTGEVRWFAKLLDDTDDPLYFQKAFDGRYILFEGGSAPITGYTLVSSPGGYSETAHSTREANHVRVLKKFPKVSIGSYLLAGLSPDRRYALVRLEEPSAWGLVSSGSVNTYYLVGVTSGETAILLKDEVVRNTKGSISAISWIGRVN